MADTHVTSGSITIGSGASAVMSGLFLASGTVSVNISGQSIKTSISGNNVIVNDGQLVVTSVSGNSVNVSNFPTVNISGESVQTSVSGNIVQTSISGNSVQLGFQQTSTFIVNNIVVPSGSGGIQLPNQQINGVTVIAAYFSGSTGGIANGFLIAGGVGSNAPYQDPSGITFPPVKGVVLQTNLMIPVSNLNQVSLVAASGASGIGALYYATI